MDRRNTWIFGYGSLMWNPGFAPAEQVLGRLTGFARSFCMWSIHHRGSPEDPGLVLALDAEENTTCDGMAFRVPERALTALSTKSESASWCRRPIWNASYG